MIKNLRFCAPALLLLVSGCATAVTGRRPQNSLDKALRYVERPVQGGDIDLSSSAASDVAVPRGSEVDINSTIAISISKDAVSAPAGTMVVEGDLLRLQEKSRKLRALVSALADVVEARNQAFEAYKKTDGIPFSSLTTTAEYKAFRDSSDNSNRLESALIDTTVDMFNAGLFPLTESELNDKFNDSTYKAFGQFLQSEIDSCGAEWAKKQEEIRQKAMSLRLEAFLEKPKGDPLAIHLAGYDSLDKREAKFKESTVLDNADWGLLQQQYQETVGLARQAERVRKGEVTLRESLKNSGIGSLQRLVELGERVEPVVRTDWDEAGKGLLKDLAEVRAISEEVAKRHAAAESQVLVGKLEALKKLALSAPSTIDIRGTITSGKALQREWASVDPQGLPAVISKTEAWAGKTVESLSKLDKFPVLTFQTEATALVASLESRPAEIPKEAWDDLCSELNRRGIVARLNAVASQAAAVRDFYAGVKAELELLKIKPSMANLRVPEAKEVLWAEAPDTEIDIQRTPRSLDDRLHVVATLKSGDQELMKSHAIFNVRQFGWHSILAPSVILAKPLNPRGAFDRDFKFAPAVVLLERYYPQNAETGAGYRVLRFLQLGIGMHATFLDQNPNKELEVGLGGAISFWQDRLVAGAGINLMDNSKGYFYIGSNLIPILQALGYGKENNTGKQP